MYRFMDAKGKIRVPPEKLGQEVEKAVTDSIKERMEGNIKKGFGVVLAITEVKEIGEGDIEPEDPGVFYPIEFRTLTFQPELHEIVEGEIAEITEFGAFVRIGPIDALCHISQIMDDYVSFDEKQNNLAGKDSNRNLKNGDVVRSRIIAVSLDKKEKNKVNLTMRQPGLGAMDWIEEEREKEEEEGEE